MRYPRLVAAAAMAVFVSSPAMAANTPAVCGQLFSLTLQLNLRVAQGWSRADLEKYAADQAYGPGGLVYRNSERNAVILQHLADQAFDRAIGDPNAALQRCLTSP